MNCSTARRLRVPLLAVLLQLPGCSDERASQPPPPISEAGMSAASAMGEAKAIVHEAFPEAWFYPDRATGRRYATPKTLEGKPAPKLKLRNWTGEPQYMDALKGKVVVVDFWATWCPPCMASIPKNVKLYETYRDEGLAFIGVHDSKRGTERIPAVINAKAITYPIAIDDGGVSTAAWKVRFWPTYSVVDRKGVVRASGLMPQYVEPVVKKLLAEDG